MVEIEVIKMQSITNEQLGKYYAKYLMEDEDNLDELNQDLAYSIDMNISDNTSDFVDVVEAVSELSFNDLAEIFQTVAQCLKKWSTCDENKG